MHILFLCGRELEYPRNWVILNALQRIADVDVIAEHGLAHSLTVRILRIAIKSIPRLIFSRYDLIFIGFYGYPLVLECHLMSRSPILFDAFVSNYDTLISDRKDFQPNSFIAMALRWLDKTACLSATRILLDTYAHKEYFVKEFSLSEAAFDILPVGAVDEIFHPTIDEEQPHPLRILYYCTYLPLHGAHVVVEAAKLLKDRDYEFVLIGSGQEYLKTRTLAKQYDLPNLTFFDNMSLQNLSREIAQADICLGGHFGQSPKAERTIPGKIYQMLASAKPVIATTTLANQELLIHRGNAYLCSPNDPTSLAQAIVTLCEDGNLRNQLAKNGRKTYVETCSEEVLQRRINTIVDKICKAGSSD